MKLQPANTSKERIIPSFPYKHVVVSTALSLDEMVKLFKDSVSQLYVPPVQFPPPLPPKNVKDLEGDIAQGGFSLRTASTKNGFRTPGMAYISGQFIDTETGINIDIHAHPGSTTFIMVILGSLVTLGSGIVMALRLSNDYFLFIGGIVVVVISIIGYIAEVDNLDLYIAKILQNHLINHKGDR